MNREEMRHHIAGLLKHDHIRHSRTQSGTPGAWTNAREVQNILPVKDEVSYATALHAQQNALDWTPAMEKERRRRMAEYEAFGPRATSPDWIKDRYVVVDGQLVEKTNSLGNGGQTNGDASIPRELGKRG